MPSTAKGVVEKTEMKEISVGRKSSF